MPLPSLEVGGLLALFVFLVPGFVAYQALSLLYPRRGELGRDFILAFLALSAVNFGLNFWLPPIVNSSEYPEWMRYALWAWFVVLSPTLIGLLIGAGLQKNWIGRLLASSPFQWMGLRPVHYIPTAWDWKFSHIQGEWVLITLKDGTEFGGYCGTESFISSETDHRDIYIETIYTIAEGRWTATNRSLYIAPGEIRSIEFIKPDEVDRDGPES